MRRIIAGSLALTLLSSAWMLGSEGATKAKKAKKAAPSVSAQIQQLQDQLNQQTQHNNQQEQRINQLQQQLEQAQQQLQSGIRQATEQAAAAQQAAASAQQSANSLTSSVSDLKTSATAVSQSLTTTQKAVKDLENPLAIHYKGVTLTPKGWVDLEASFYNRNMNSDNIVSQASVPLNNNANDTLHSVWLTGRPSRIGLQVDGQTSPATKLRGYWEFDTETTVPGPSAVQTNNFVMRQRQLWGQVKHDSWTVTAGQAWSLFTPSRLGVDPLFEFIPINTEQNTVVGYTYKRQAQLRVTKQLNPKLWLGFSVENAEYTFSSTNFPNDVLGLATSTNAASPFSYLVPQFSATDQTGTSVSNISGGFVQAAAPDLIAKVAFEPGWGHYELAAVGRVFRDRVQTSTTDPRQGVSQTTYGGGVRATAIMPVTKKVDFIVNAHAGAGTGSYNASGSTDLTFNNNLQLIPIKTASGLLGLELHPLPRLDVYGYFGEEYYQREQYTCTNATFCNATGFGASGNAGNANFTGKPVGYGDLAYAPGTNNRILQQASVGYYYRIYRGHAGTLQQGLNYNYFRRVTWTGTPTVSSPRANLAGTESTTYVELKYILP